MMNASNYRFSYSFEIKHIYISPGHNYYTHDPESPGTHSTHDVDEVEAVAGMGLRGDRFFGYKEGFEGQITFFSWEVYEEIALELGIADKQPAVFRRNIIVSGLPLNALMGEPFSIGDVAFLGSKHCTPCHWMDNGFGHGALRLLRGRGGLRARILKSGILMKGRNTMKTPRSKLRGI